jgi:hypothetical protein
VGQNDRDTVDATSPAYDRMAKRWELPIDLMGGTAAMAEAAEKWLPMEPRESDTQYAARLKRTKLYNGFHKVVRSVTSQPFSQPLTPPENLPERLADIPDNADRSGRSLHEFARDVFLDGMVYGVAYILVDFPSDVPDVRTVGDDRRLGVRPWFVRIPPPNLFAFSDRKNPRGERELTQIRWKEARTSKKGQFAQSDSEVIRVWNAPSDAGGGTIQEWARPDGSDEWGIISEATHSYDGVPLIPVYFRRTGFMEARPTLEDLAELNLEHWQAYSDYRTIAHAAQTVTAVFFGFDEKSFPGGKVPLGVNSAIITSQPSTQADAKFLEVSGEGPAVGERLVRAIEERMETEGLLPFIKRSGNVTATAQRQHGDDKDNDARAYVATLEDGLGQALDVAGRWVGLDLSDEQTRVGIFSDFSVGDVLDQDRPWLEWLHGAGLLSDEDALREVRRRGVLSDDVPIEDLLRKARTQPSRVPEVSGFDRGDPITDDEDGGEED